MGTAEICDDKEDNDCDGLVDAADTDDCGGGSCVGIPAEASTYHSIDVLDFSDLERHLAYLLLPLGLVIGLIIWCRKR